MACTRHGVQTKEPDAQAIELSVSTLLPSGTAPVMAEVDTGSPSPSAFPPPIFHIVARSESEHWSGARKWYWIHTSIGKNTTFIVSPPSSRFGFAERPLLTSIEPLHGVCSPSRALSEGFPPLGLINLNSEPDRLFGIFYPDHHVAVWEEHRGYRLLNDFQLEAGGDGWAVTTRREDVGPSNRQLYERRVGVSDLYERKVGRRWRRTAGTNKFGVTWPYAGPFGSGFLVVEKSEKVEDRGLEPHWSLRAFGAGSRPTPKLSNPDAVLPNRIQVFRTFSNGEVLAVGASFNKALMIERWGAGEQTSTLQTMDTIVPRHPESVDPDGWPNPILTFEVEGPSVIRVRTEQGNMVELRFDGSTWKASPPPEVTELAVEHALRIFRPYAPDIAVQNVERREDATYVWALDKRVQETPKSLLLRDTPYPAICDVPINPPK